jgi:hypothetical protein
MDNEPNKPHIITETRLIVLNSKDATKLNGGMNSNVIFEFNDIMLKSNDIIYTTLAVLDAEIPASYYNVNGNNNTTSVTRNGVTAALITSSGNYNALQYITEFKGKYETAF